MSSLVQGYWRAAAKRKERVVAACKQLQYTTINPQTNQTMGRKGAASARYEECGYFRVFVRVPLNL